MTRAQRKNARQDAIYAEADRLRYDEDSRARRDALVAALEDAEVPFVEPLCGHCGLRPGAGAAGLCLECNDLADALGETDAT